MAVGGSISFFEIPTDRHFPNSERIIFAAMISLPGAAAKDQEQSRAYSVLSP
jgi:hypothetical protein